MTLSSARRDALALDALVGLSTADAFGNQAFPVDRRVVAPDFPAETWAWTDDTQMACSLVDVLRRNGRVDQDELAGAFAARAEDCRDYGMGALRFLARVRGGGDWRQVSTELFDGVGSWGNGGAMRVSPLGAYYCGDLATAAEEAAASAEVTHSHPEGIAGAIAVGVAAAHAAALRGTTVARPSAELIEAVLGYVPSGPVRSGLERATRLLDRPAHEVAGELGNGARISAADTVPFALWVVATRLDDYEAAVRACADAGGDMDTTAAIVGGVIAAHHGAGCVPTAWLAAREPLPSWLPGSPG